MTPDQPDTLRGQPDPDRLDQALANLRGNPALDTAPTLEDAWRTVHGTPKADGSHLDAFARALGSPSASDLETWASAHPRIWGNRQGALLFLSPDAYRDASNRRAGDWSPPAAFRHWQQVSRRIRRDMSLRTAYNAGNRRLPVYKSPGDFVDAAVDSVCALLPLRLYAFDPGTWHQPDPAWKRPCCRVGVEGAVIAHRLQAPPTLAFNPSDFPPRVFFLLHALRRLPTARTAAGISILISLARHEPGPADDGILSDPRMLPDDVRDAALATVRVFGRDLRREGAWTTKDELRTYLATLRHLASWLRDYVPAL